MFRALLLLIKSYYLVLSLSLFLTWTCSHLIPLNRPPRSKGHSARMISRKRQRPILTAAIMATSLPMMKVMQIPLLGTKRRSGRQGRNSGWVCAHFVLRTMNARGAAIVVRVTPKSYRLDSTSIEERRVITTYFPHYG